MTDLLKQLDAAAELGKKANPRPYKWSGGDKWNPKYLDDDGGSTVVEAASEVVGYDNYRLALDVTPDNQAYLVAAANLDLAAVAAELRAKDAEIERLRGALKSIDDYQPMQGTGLDWNIKNLRNIASAALAQPGATP